MKIVPPSLGKLTMWVTDAATVFINGCMSGLTAGGASGVGSAGVTATPIGDAMPPTTKLSAALLSAAIAIGGNGLKHFVIWHHANPMPNPFAPVTNPPGFTTSNEPLPNQSS